MAQADVLLTVENLSISFGSANVVDNVSFEVRRNEVVAVVGESGSGKTVTVFAATGLVPQGSRVSGRSVFDGTELTGLDPGRLHRLYGRKIGYVFQDVMTSLSPLRTIRSQMFETLREHLSLTRGECEEKSRSILARCGIAEPTRILDSFPHALSGGLRQRVMIALAAGLEPPLLVADEPTTALDTTTQAIVLTTLLRTAKANESSVLLVTHNISIVAAIASRVLVMYCGRLVESGPTEILLRSPRHPYTSALLAAVPRISKGRGTRLAGIPGDMASSRSRQGGCVFEPRCPKARQRCADTEPLLEPDHRPEAKERTFACHFPLGETEAFTAQLGGRE